MKEPICDEKDCEKPVILMAPDMIPPHTVQEVDRIMSNVGCRKRPEYAIKIQGFESITYSCDDEIQVKLNHYTQNGVGQRDLWMFINDRGFFKEDHLPDRVDGTFQEVKFTTSNGDLKASIILPEEDFTTERKIKRALTKLRKLRKGVNRINTEEFITDLSNLNQLFEGAEDARSTASNDPFNIEHLQLKVKSLDEEVKSFKEKYGVIIKSTQDRPQLVEKKGNLLTDLGRHLGILR